MRTLLVVILLLCVGYGAYRYWYEPAGSVTMTESPAPRAARITLPAGPAAAWTPPAIIPAQPNWTWTTTDGKVYHDVKIVRMDSTSVTILHSQDGGKIRLSDLPPDMQRYFNYTPAAQPHGGP